jgi:hypothetical protein
MKTLHNAHPIRIFWISSLITLGLGLLVTSKLGLAGLWIYLILVILEVTFSFDNAVINSKVLARLSPFWQKLFLTLGIFIAVFVVRFLLPIVIVMIASNQTFIAVVNMALYDASAYGATLSRAAPMIDAFGGTFLIMIGISYFMDRKKDIHWLGRIEQKLASAGRFENLKVLVMLSVAMIMYATVDKTYQTTVLGASILGVMLHMGLELLGHVFESTQKTKAMQQVGMAAFVSFVYLEVLDASFSFDGVIGAFAITNDVLLIIAGLGAGAIWVRSLTVYLLRTGTLTKYRYLEHGAHWAILALGVVMFVKLYHIEPPEWLTGALGLVFIATAIVSSTIERRRGQLSDSYKGWS